MADPTAFYREVGQNVRRKREQLGLTQEALALQVALTRTSITNIEKGRQKLLLHTLVDIAHALSVDPALLLPAIIDGSKERLDGKNIYALWLNASLRAMLFLLLLYALSNLLWHWV